MINYTDIGINTLLPHECTFLESFMYDEDYMSRPVAFGDEANVYIFERLAIKYRRYAMNLTNEIKAQQLMASVSDNFLPVYAYGENFIVMPWVAGTILEELNPSSDWLKQLASELAPAFVQAGVEPKDLHQGNVIIDYSGKAYVIDLSRYFIYSGTDSKYIPPLHEMEEHVYNSLEA
ncbi:hypothetical protein ABGV42_01185 [Paenibacillus pabuli]|uniref:hypothetical protein n=1 Tax=Paenibacillus pabuli TaxID=1472 RepID=UPI0032426552